MASWRKSAWACVAAIAALLPCAQATSQMLRILDDGEYEAEEVGYDEVIVEAEPLMDDVGEEPLYETEGDWVDPSLPPPDAAEYELANEYASDGIAPHAAPHRRHRHGRARHHGSELYERLRAPERTRSWTNRPYSIGWFAGGIFGSELISDRVDQESGFFTGGRLGWDFAESWGLETRVGFSDMNLRAEDPDVFIDKNDIFYWDINWMYYPWGEARLRPFLSIGLGMHQPDFVDDTGYRVKDTVFAVPFGMGFKYRIDQRVVLRFDLQNNYAFAGGHDVEATNNIAVMGGIELRFGGRKKSYWPWDPGRTWW
jgi:hypothetical protein